MTSKSVLAMATLLLLTFIPATLRAQDSQELSANDLFEAAQTGDIEKVQAALDAGIEVDAKTKYQATALSFAAEKGHLEIVKLLIEKGADPNPQDTFYNATPLMWANMKQHKEVATFLKEKGAKLPVRKADPEKAKSKALTREEKEAKEKEAKEKQAEEKKAEEEKGETSDEPKFLPDSDESRMADREVSSSNWPQFRGTGARGIADGQNPPIHWGVGENEKNLRWKSRIEGLGHSCPVIYGDYIYLTTAISGAGDTSIKPGQYGGVDSVEDESEHTFKVVCLNKADGSVAWEKVATKGIPKVKRHLKSTHANCTVATNGTHVVAFFAGEGLYCYTTDGELVWNKDLGMLDSGWFYDKSYQWGFAASPIIFDGNVIVQCDVQEQSFIASFSLSNGEEVWKTDRDEIPGWSTPTVVDSPRGPMLLTHGTGFARGYNANTGEEFWRFGKHSEIVVPTPFVAHDLIYIVSGYTPIQPIVAISLDAEGDITLDEGEESSEHVAWYKPRGGSYMPSPIVYGDYMYICANSGIISCIHAKTGERVYRNRLTKGVKDLEKKNDEEYEVGGSTSMVGSPIAADGHIYFPCEEGFVFVMKAGPEFELVAVNPIDENLLTTPAISEGVFFVRGQEHLFAFEDNGDSSDGVEEGKDSDGEDAEDDDQ